MPIYRQKPPFGTQINRQHRLAKGLVGMWVFNEGKGTIAYDLSGNRNHGTLIGMSFPPTTTSGWAGMNGLSLDGVDDNIDAGNGASLQITGSLSVSAWIKTSDTAGRIVGKFESTDSKIAYVFNISVAPYLGVSGNGDILASRTISGNALNNQWHHVVGVFDASAQTISMYLDGILSQGTLSGTVPSSIYNCTGNVKMGYDYGGNGYLNGLIDNVLIYNRVLSAGEVRELFVDRWAIFNRIDKYVSISFPPLPIPAAKRLLQVNYGQFGIYQRRVTLADGYSLSKGLQLGDYIGGYQEFITNQKSRQRKPTFSAILELQGDISNDIKSIDCNAEITNTLHQPSYGHGNIVLSDANGKYMEGSRCIIEPMTKISIFAGFNDMNIPIWSGLVTEAKADTSSHIVNLSLSQAGHLLANSNTSGDFSAYNTSKLMINYLLTRTGLPSAIYENETGDATNIVFGDTFQENDRSLWAMVHGSCLNIFSVPYFDVNGILNIKRRDSLNDVDYLFEDGNTQSIRFVEEAELINRKVIDYTNPPLFEFTLGDGVYPSQHIRSKSNSYSISQWGENSDYETDPFIGAWERAGDIIDEILDYFPYKRALYEVMSAGVPQLEQFDMVRVKSVRQAIEGRFVILGVRHSITPGYYTTTHKLLSFEERL